MMKALFTSNYGSRGHVSLCPHPKSERDLPRLFRVLWILVLDFFSCFSGALLFSWNVDVPPYLGLISYLSD